MNKPTINLTPVYQPHPNQLAIHTSEAKYRVVVAGRRFGKSALALNEALFALMDTRTPRQMIWIILPQYNQAKSIYWIDPDITKYFMPYVQAGVLKKNDNDLSLYCYATESFLFLKGSDNSDSLRGSGLDLIVWDEVADVKPDAFNVITPALADSPYHRVLYMGTPDGYNHFHDFALMGDRKGIIEHAGKDISLDPDYQTFKFTSYDNLAFVEGTPERRAFVNFLDKERKKYQEQGQEDWFEQEYMAAFRKRAGAVHKLFDRTIHFIPGFAVPPEWRRMRGWDFGSSHPTASLRIAEDPDDNWFVEISYKQKDAFVQTHAERVKQQDAEFLTDADQDPVVGYGDPSGAQWIKEFNNLGMTIYAAKRSQRTEKKSWLELAIDLLNAKIAPKEAHVVYLPDGRVITNAPSLFIFQNKENDDLVSEIETLTYKKTNDGITKTDIDDTKDVKGHYDLHACLRYVAVSESSEANWTPVYKTVDARPLNEKTTAPAELSNEEKRRQLELEADLQIMRNRKAQWW